MFRAKDVAFLQQACVETVNEGATCEIESVETHQIVNGHWLNTVNVLAAAPEARARENAAVKNFIVV